MTARNKKKGACLANIVMLFIFIIAIVTVGVFYFNYSIIAVNDYSEEKRKISDLDSRISSIKESLKKPSLSRLRRTEKENDLYLLGMQKFKAEYDSLSNRIIADRGFIYYVKLYFAEQVFINQHKDEIRGSIPRRISFRECMKEDIHEYLQNLLPTDCPEYFFYQVEEFKRNFKTGSWYDRDQLESNIISNCSFHGYYVVSQRRILKEIEEIENEIAQLKNLIHKDESVKAEEQLFKIHWLADRKCLLEYENLPNQFLLLVGRESYEKRWLEKSNSIEFKNFDPAKSPTDRELVKNEIHEAVKDISIEGCSPEFASKFNEMKTDFKNSSWERLDQLESELRKIIEHASISLLAKKIFSSSDQPIGAPLKRK